MTQKQKVLEYMRKHEGISTYTAFQMRITRLAARISELRDDGYCILSERRMSAEKKPYVLYRLEERKS
jgi:hypothetical protein